MSTQDTRQIITVFVLASSNDDKHLLAYEIETSEAEVMDAEHYETAKRKAEEAGFHPIEAFDIHEKAGQQLIGKAKLGGELTSLATAVVERPWTATL